MLEKVTESCSFLLENYPEAQNCKSYLDSRLSFECQNKWNFGYFPGMQNIAALTDLVGEELLIKLKLLYVNNFEDSLSPRRVVTNYFEDHPLVMPFRNTYGKIVALVGRTLLDENSRKQKNVIKYKNTHGTQDFEKSTLLFGLYENKQHILNENCVYIVEGQFDVIKASEIGFQNIVAIGTNNMSNYQFSLINRYSNNIFLLLDNDEAGQIGRKRILKKFEQYANIRNFYIPEEFKDIDEYITNAKIKNFNEISFSVKC